MSEPVATSSPGEDIPAPPSTPSIMRRVAAIPYEGLLLLALVLIASFPIAGLKGLTLAGMPHIIFQGYLLLITGLYFTWQWQKNGQTLPMKTWRFRVVNVNGKRVSWGRAILRFFSALFFFGPACAGVLLLFFPARLSPLITMWAFFPLMATVLYARFDVDGQFLHDRLAGTRIEDAPAPQPRKS